MSSSPTIPIKGAGPAWEANYSQLCQFQQENGHCNVPTHGKLRYVAKWCCRIRATKAHLTGEQIKALDDIGFDWVSRKDKEDAKWNEMFDRFARYKAEKNTCLVPQDYAEDPELGTWVANQRRRSKQGKVRVDRAEKLASLGFVWKARELNKKRIHKSGKYDDKWMEMFHKLRAYKEEHGHCNVPYNSEDKALAMWVSTQRRVQRKKTFMYGDEKEMRPERKELLASIGFDFNFGYNRKEKVNQGSNDIGNVHPASGAGGAPMDVHFPETLIEGAIIDAIESKPVGLSELGKNEQVYPDASMPDEELALYEAAMGEPSATEDTGSGLAVKMQTSDDQSDAVQV
jgi:hypothetical protein